MVESAVRLTVMLPLKTFMRTSGGEEAQPALAFASLILLQREKDTLKCTIFYSFFCLLTICY